MYISISSYTYTYRYIHIHINIYIHTSSTATTTMTHPHIHRGGGGTRNQRKSAASETSKAPPQPHNHRGGGDHDPSTGGGGGRRCTIYTQIYHIRKCTNLCSVVRLGFYLFAFTVPSRCSTHMAVSSPAFILTSASRFCLGFRDSCVILQITTWWVSQEMIQVGYIHTHISYACIYIYIHIYICMLIMLC